MSHGNDGVESMHSVNALMIEKSAGCVVWLGLSKTEAINMNKCV